MPFVTPIVGIEFETIKPLSLEFTTYPIDSTKAHPCFPNGTKQYHATAYSGSVTIAVNGGGDSRIILSHPWEIGEAGQIVEGGMSFFKSSDVQAILCLSGIDPNCLSIKSGYPFRKWTGKHMLPTLPKGVPTRQEGYTHRFDVQTPLLGGVTIFATRENPFGLKRELKY